MAKQHLDVFCALDGLAVIPQLADQEVAGLVNALLDGDRVGP